MSPLANQSPVLVVGIGSAAGDDALGPEVAARVLAEDAEVLAGRTIRNIDDTPHPLTGLPRWRIVTKGSCLDPDGQPARVGRIDADTTRHKGALEAQLAQVHEGEIDVLVGTQMVAKGHDFRRITLVAAVQPDGALFSSDFRAPERLFCLLMQAAGRAGRDASYVSDQGSQPEMWVQTAEPQHSVFTALRQHDYPAFAARQLQERHDAGMPPFAFQTLVRADAKTQAAAQDFLRAVSDAACQGQLPHLDDVFLYPPIPMTVQRVANVERAQMLIEAADRRALQRFLHAWQPWLHWVRSQPQHKGVVRWLMDVDPLSL